MKPQQFGPHDSDVHGSEEHVIEARLTPDGEYTIVSIEERGMPTNLLSVYGAEVQILWGSNIRSSALTCTFPRRSASDLSSRSMVMTELSDCSK
jgi:hypothetical protein